MTPKRMRVIAILAAAFAGFALLIPSVTHASIVPCTDFNDKTLLEVISSLKPGSECIIDDKTFHAITASSNLGSATITFVNTPFNPGFDLTNITGLSVTAGQTVTFDLGTMVTVNAGGSLIKDLELFATGAKTGDSHLGGTGTLSSTTPGFTVLSPSPPGSNPFDVTFTPTDNLSASGTFTLEGNTGTGSITSGSIHFSEVVVPEPVSFTLMGTGLLGLAALLRRGRVNPRV